MCDNSEKYKVIFKKIEYKLDTLKNEEEDVSEYQEKLNIINKNLESWLICSNDYNIKRTIFSKGINLLNNLNQEIETEFNYNFKHRKLNYLLDISNSVVSCLDKITPNLDSISKELINDIYKIAYQICKLEFYYNNDSIIWNYCKSNKKHMKHISKEILKDIQKYMINSKNKDKIINEKFNTEILKDVNKLLINSASKNKIIIEEFIKTISNSESKTLESNLINSLNNLKIKLDNIIFQISKNQKSIKSNKKDINEIKVKLENQRKYRAKSILKAISSWILTISILSGAIYGSARNKKYRNYIQKYSSIDSSISETDTGYKSEIESLHTYIIVYGDAIPKNHAYARSVYTFDVSNIKSNDINDYLGLDLSCYDYTTNHIFETSPNHTSEYVEIYKQKVDKNDYNNDFSIKEMYMYMIVYIILTLSLEKLIEMVYKKSQFGIVSPWINLYNELHTNTDNSETFEEKINRLSNDNYKLKNNINELLKDKDFILNLYNELINNDYIKFKLSDSPKTRKKGVK